MPRAGRYKIARLRHANAEIPRSTLRQWQLANQEIPAAPVVVHAAVEHEVNGRGQDNLSENSASEMETSDRGDVGMSGDDFASDGASGSRSGQDTSGDNRSDSEVTDDPYDSTSSSNTSGGDSDSSIEPSGDDRDADNQEDVDVSEEDEEVNVRHSPEPFLNPIPPPRIQLENNAQQARQPLYHGCQISKEESALLTMSYIIRFGVQDNGIEELLHLIDCHLPYPVLDSKYVFLKQFPTPEEMKVRHFCSRCSKLLPHDFPGGQCTCGNVCNITDLTNNGSYYVELSIAEQIKQIYRDEKLYNQLRKSCPEKDVVEGSVYKELRRTGVIGDDDLTLQWNTDGVKPFKSSKITMWPIQACINELPYQARRDNMILCGLYYGKCKPFINSFLKPFVEELDILHNEGIQCCPPGGNEPLTVKVHAIVAPVDSVARAPLQGIKQYNGRYGCSFCLRMGSRIARGRGHARVYSGGSGTLRNLEQHLNAIEELEEYNRTHRKKKTNIQGVRYASRVILIPVFDVISSFTPDFLHSALEGVVKTFLNFWTNSSNKGMDWHLPKSKMRILNAKLLAIKPCKEITRVPRSVEDISLWKASEFMNFLLYFSIICLKGLLPQKYLNHWFLFVYSMTIFLKESYTEAEFLKAKRAILQFVMEIPEVYTNCYHLCTFNVHLLVHFPDAVERFGGLWASSTFPFEHYNGVLTRLITGSQYVPTQICRSFLRVRQVAVKGKEIFSSAECYDKAKTLYKSLTSRYYSSNSSVQHSEGLRLFGALDHYALSLIERVSIQQLLQVDHVETIAKSYRRMILRGTVYHANHYNTLRVRDNSTVLVSNVFMSVQRILLVLAGQEEHCLIIGEMLEPVEEELCRDRGLNITSNTFFNVCQRSGITVSQFACDISKKCVQVPYNNCLCVVPLVNNITRD